METEPEVKTEPQAGDREGERWWGMQSKSSDVLNYGKEVDSPSMADAPMRAYRPGVDQVYTEHQRQ